MTPAADEILEDKGVLVLPDVLANAGGVVVSYFEWVQGLQEYFWKEDEVNRRLNDIVTRAFDETCATRKLARRSMRMAAYGLAVQRVAEATVTRGLYPLASGRSRCTTGGAARSASVPGGRWRGCSGSSASRTPRSTSRRIPSSRPRYREWLPVVEIDGERAFVYYVDETALRRKLAAD